MYIINTIPHGKCFVRYLRTRCFCIRNLTRSLRSLVRFLIRQQLLCKYCAPSSFHEVFSISSLLSLDMVFHWLTICIVDANLLDRIRRLSSDWAVGLVAFPFSPTENRNGVVQPPKVRVNTRQWISSHDLLASILFHVQYSSRTVYLNTVFYLFQVRIIKCC